MGGRGEGLTTSFNHSRHQPLTTTILPPRFAPEQCTTPHSGAVSPPPPPPSPPTTTLAPHSRPCQLHRLDPALVHPHVMDTRREWAAGGGRLRRFPHSLTTLTTTLPGALATGALGHALQRDRKPAGLHGLHSYVEGRRGGAEGWDHGSTGARAGGSCREAREGRKGGGAEGWQEAKGKGGGGGGRETARRRERQQVPHPTDQLTKPHPDTHTQWCSSSL